MSGAESSKNATKTIAIKRKRVPVWPLATRAALEAALSSLTKAGSVRELAPTPDAWRVHPSTEARGSGFQWERRIMGLNDCDQWTDIKIRQHAQNPERSAGRTGFEGGYVSRLNSDLTELLRSANRGAGRNPNVQKGAAGEEQQSGGSRSAGGVRTGRDLKRPMEAGSQEPPPPREVASRDKTAAPTVVPASPCLSADRLEEEAASPPQPTNSPPRVQSPSQPQSPSSSADSLPSVPSTVPYGSPQAQLRDIFINPDDNSPFLNEADDNYRGADGLWYFPDGRWHPCNLYAEDP